MEAITLQKSIMSKRMKESEDEETTRIRKRKKFDWFVCLPDDILIEILKRVPDVFLRYKAKYVCRRWSIIITNRILLDHASCILQNFLTSKTRLVDILEKEEGIQVKEQVLDMPHKGIIRSWCNEFVLMSDLNNLFVYNLITKEVSYLPECDASCGGHFTCKCAVALSFDRFKGIYKVSHLFIGHRTVECQFFILRNHTITRTLSKWKKLEVPYKNEGQHILGDPVTVQGRYLNWIIRNSDNLVSVDMVKEEIRIISLPGDGEFVYSIFVMGGCLALMKRVSWDKAEIWLLKDFEKVKWEKLHSMSEISRYFDGYPGKVIAYHIYGCISK